MYSLSKNKSIKIGIIGCGLITSELKFFSKFLKKAKIQCATDLVFKRAKKIAGEAHAHIDLEKMFMNEDIDAIYIATPPHLHKKYIHEAFKKGKHVLCEKPVAVSLQEAREILNLDKKFRNLKLGFNYQYRYDSNCINLVKGLNNDQIGDIYYSNCSIFFSRDFNYFNKADWRSKLQTAGGGTLLSQGSHLIDIMIWALGEPKSVIGKIGRLKFKNVEVEDTGFGIVEFENGILGQINSSMIVEPRVKPAGDSCELLVFGEKGRAIYLGPWPSSLEWFGSSNLKLVSDLKEIPPLIYSINAFIEWIVEDKPYLNTIEESTKVLRVIMALYKSSMTGKEEKIEKL